VKQEIAKNIRNQRCRRRNRRHPRKTLRHPPNPCLYIWLYECGKDL